MSTGPKNSIPTSKSVRTKGVGTRSTGPKSAQGKDKSSRNAVSHGLTSNRVMPDEVRMVEEFSEELTRYYKPESPLESLQIQRIAFCRAKLAKLIDIEVAGREVARRQIELDPEMVMGRLTQYPENVKRMALAELKGQPVLSEFGLDESTWNSIVKEIQAFSSTLQGEEDLGVHFPKLMAYLTSIDPVEGQIADLGPDQALMIFVQRIRNFHSNEEQLSNLQNTSKDDRESRFNDLMLRVRRMKDIEQMATRKMVRNKMSGDVGYQQAVDADLQEITSLAAKLARVPAVLESFEEMKGWMIRSADLESELGEKMMKYQTMLERRLSSAIGELLELRKYRIN